MARNHYLLVGAVFVLVLSACAGGGPPVPGGGRDLPTGGQGAVQTAQAAAGQAGVAATALAESTPALPVVTVPPGDGQATAEWALTQVAAAVATGQAATPVTQPTIVSPAEASDVIATYAVEVLGREVAIVYAGGMTGAIGQALSLPPAAAASQTQAENVAYATYGALLSNGAASVSYGSGSIVGDVSVDIQAASLGAFSLLSASKPGSEADALALVLAAFPGLSNRAYTPASVARGYAWTFEGQAPGYDIRANQATLVAEVILIGVDLGPRQTVVYAVVGRGTLAQSVQFPRR